MSVTYSESIELFMQQICSVCKLCDSKLPSFCFSLYLSDSDRFMKFVQYINVLRIKNDVEALRAVYSFEGFAGLFCNSVCNNGAVHKLPPAKCKDLKVVIGCYESFMYQFGSLLDLKEQIKIYSKFSGIPIKSIGRKFKLTSTDPLKFLTKRQRKRLSKHSKRARAAMDKMLFGKISKQKKVDKKGKKEKEKPITTLFFYNTDDEWERTIHSYLNNETDNRQSTTTT